MEKTQPSKSTKAVRFLVITILFSIALMFFVSKDFAAIGVVVRKSGIYGLIIGVILYGVLGASVIPSEPLTILLSAIYGPFHATIAASIGNLLAAGTEYFIGMKIGDVSSFMEKKDKLPFGLGKFPIDSPILLIGGRLIPGYGSKLISILGGIYRVKPWRYIWSTAIPTFIGAAITAYGGYGALSWIHKF